MSGPPEYSTRELSKETWPDFEKLFRKKGEVGDGWWCWCTWHHRESDSIGKKRPHTRADWATWTRQEQQRLVRDGKSHGILVYSDGIPVGWCQYGPREELPRTDSFRAYRKLGLKTGLGKSWRITCFVIHQDHRRRGVATRALEAVLGSIRRQGGGLLEAYPVKESDQGANYLYTGTVSMFERAGFKTIASLGPGRTSRVVMQRSIQ